MSTQQHSPLSRRAFLRTATATGAAIVSGNHRAFSAPDARPSLARVIGITTGGLNYQRENNILTALTLPEFMRDELGMQLIDLNTRWLTSFDAQYVSRVRASAEKTGCYFTNLKVNHKFGDLYAADVDEAKAAMAMARELVLTAKTLGARWIRFPFPKSHAGGDAGKDPAAHRELANLAGEHGLALVVENGGWMQSDPDSITRLVNAIGKNAVAGPDTGNWDDAVRFEAIAKSCRGAATCDFKVWELDPEGNHARYNIRKCFDAAWNAGFRGPWAIEHWNEDLKEFARETIFLRNQLVEWM